VDDEIQLISDGDGIAVIGAPAAIERFLNSEGLASRDLGLQRLRPALSTASAVTMAGSEIATNAGRWVKITNNSAKLLSKQGNKLMKGPTADVSRGVIQGKSGQIQGIVQFVRGPGAILTNPAILAGAAGIMAQIAMQQAMDEITEYLAVIDEKVDDILRAQTDAVLADLIGVGFALEEAMTIRGQVGRVSEVTWSKVQTTPMTIARTQGYALRQLDALAEKMEQKANLGDLAKTSKIAQEKVPEWLAVLARCFQLQDAFTVLELDRVLDADPIDLDNHRVALKTARQNRLATISRSTEQLMARMDAAAVSANSKVLFHPLDARAVVESSNHVAIGVVSFHGALGIEDGRESLEAKRWAHAATEARDKVIGSGAEGVDAAARLGTETLGRAKSMTDKLSLKMAAGALRRRADAEVSPDLKKNDDV